MTPTVKGRASYVDRPRARGGCGRCCRSYDGLVRLHPNSRLPASVGPDGKVGPDSEIRYSGSPASCRASRYLAKSSGRNGPTRSLRFESRVAGFSSRTRTMVFRTRSKWPESAWLAATPPSQKCPSWTHFSTRTVDRALSCDGYGWRDERVGPSH
jgi:hypothetical protein